MPPLRKHSRIQFLPSMPQPATPKFRILPLPTAHRTLFSGEQEWGKPSRLPACLLFMVIIVTEHLSTRDKNPKINYCFLASNRNYLLFTFQGGGKKIRSSSSPASTVCISFGVSFTTLALSHRFFKAINSTTPGYFNNH